MTPTSSAGPTPAPAPSPATGAVAVEPTHGCARCGRPVPIGVGLCETCNPLGLRDVAASQVHGTVIIAVLVGIVLLAIGARLTMSGVGPYPVSLDAAVPVATGITVTLTVTNEGTAEGQTTCRVYDPGDAGGGPSAIVLSPRIAAGQTRTFESTIVEFGTTVRDFAVECRTP